ncbi:MAG: tetratricopeptide repeat protein [Atribacterota bacterium]
MEKQKSKGIPELDEVRSWIEEYVKRVANLKDQKGKEVELLCLRDRIEEWLSFYRSQGAFVDPEETRVGNFDALFEKQCFLFIRMLGKRTLEEERKKHNPPKERWWWWIDETVKQKRRAQARKRLMFSGVTVAIILSLYFLVFRLPPAEQNYLNAMSRAEQGIDKAQWEEAIQACQEAITLFPERSTPYVIMGCIYEKLGKEENAKAIFAQVESLYSRKSDFLLEKAMWYFRLALLDRSKATIAEILEEDPENLSALNLLGSLYEAENKVVEAIKVYEKLLALAEEKEELNLIPMVKMKIGMLQLKLPLTLP